MSKQRHGVGKKEGRQKLMQMVRSDKTNEIYRDKKKKK
jgi:hypothetical protein